MRDTYSLYEAKARLSAIVRRVREGAHVVITLRGEAVAEIRPVMPEHAGIESRLGTLAERGVLVRSPAHGRGPFRVGAVRRGTLRRFLADRGE